MVTRPVVVCALALVTSCFQAASKDCGDTICPPASVCAPAGNACVNPDQVTTCAGQAEGAMCSTAEIANGACVQGVCVLAGVCGNGVVEAGEACDDGNNISGDGCSKDCESNESCGNGILDPLTEQCDCGADAASQSASCTEPNSNAAGAMCRPDCTYARCGDGIKDLDEQCDGTAGLETLTCESYGYYAAPGLACTSFCSIDHSMCTGGLCGDGIINGLEACDGGPPPNASCGDYGFDFGALGCNAACTPSASGCEHLGWSIVGSFPSEGFDGAWADSDDDIFALGNAGVYHFDGKAWTIDASVANYHRIWGSGPNDVWAIAELSPLAHYNGTAWSTVSLPSNGGLEGLGGTGPTDVWIATKGGTMLHYDGTTWTQSAQVATGFSGATIWGSSASDVYVADAYGLHHWNGSAWSVVSVTSGAPPYTAITGSSANDVWLGSDMIPVSAWHWNGSAWTTVSVAGGVSSASETAPDDLFAVVNGNMITRWNGVGWDTQTLPVNVGQLQWLWAWAPGHAVASGGGYVLRYRTGYWRAPGPLSQQWIVGGVWAAAQNAVFVVGTAGNTEYFNGTAWTPANVTSSVDFNDVWADSASDAFAVGSDTSGTGVIYHWTGSAWTSMGGLGSPSRISGVWGAASNDVWAVGAGGEIRHYNGSQWSKVTSGTTLNLGTVWGSASNDVFAGGGNGSTTAVLLHWNGTAWTPMTTPSAHAISEIRGSGPNDVYASVSTSAGGALWHYDGTAWSAVPGAPVPQTIAVRTPSDVWLVDSSGSKLYHYDGTTFAALKVPTIALLGDLAAIRGRLFIASDQLYDLARSCDCL